MRTERFQQILEIFGNIDPKRFASVLCEGERYERNANA